MLILSPLREAAKIVKDLARICMKDVWAVFVDQDAVVIVVIICVSADMIPYIANEDPFP